VFGIGTGEFIIEWSSESLRCDGLAIFDDGGATSAGLDSALWAFDAGVDGCARPCADTDGRRASAEPFDGCEDGRRSLMV
jgi:hypothetical protein